MNEWTEQATYRQSVQDKLDLIVEHGRTTNAHLKTLNGRVGASEQWIARLQVGYGLGAALGIAVVVWVLNKL